MAAHMSSAANPAYKDKGPAGEHNGAQNHSEAKSGRASELNSSFSTVKLLDARTCIDLLEIYQSE